MRERYLLILVGLVVALLALGAVPSLLQSGDPYYVTVEPVDVDDRPAFDVTNVSERRYPYVSSAIEDGESDAYYEGPFGVKESFAHSPFDEFGAIETREPEAVDAQGTIAYVEYDGTVYRLEIVRRDA